MSAREKNYSLHDLGKYADLGAKEFDGAKGRFMLGKALGLTGCEVSINSTPAGGFAPFVHSHKMNEEVYIIVSGTGMFYVDGEEFPIREGSLIRVAPNGKRAIKAADPLVYICIQANQGSLKQATMEDGVLNEEKASWM
jgi:Mannose-6-phosphate isomerase